MQQQRLLLALVISAAILFGWSYLFPVKNPKPTQAPAGNAPPTPQLATGNQPAATPSQGTQPPAALAAQTTPQRVIQITTPLYQVKLDSQGAVATSWILRKNQANGRPLFSDGVSRNNPIPLELVSAEGLNHQPREAPLQVVTGDPGLNYLLYSRNFSVEGFEKNSGAIEINLAAGEKRTITFTLSEPSQGFSLQKAITFDADSYNTQVALKATKGGQTVPDLKLQVGPSIGDQGIKHYNFYSAAPEAVAAVAGRIERHAPNTINESKHSPDRLVLPGPVDWAAVGDTYFAMAAIPARQLEGLEYHTAEYDWKNGGKPEKRFLLRGLVPVTADGSPTIVFVGPKDHYLLQRLSQELAAKTNRTIDLGGMINYGFGAIIARPIAERLLWCIRKLYELTGSYGVAIILFTIIIYSAFFPLKWRSSKAMKKAQKLAPRMKELQEKIKGMKQTDPRLKDLQMEQLRLMKEGNPLGGCLPLLIQMPFLFALYRAITISLDFRQASFLWLGDLSSPEPYLIRVLPILMAVTMIVLQLITPAPSADPVQRKMMAIGMPLFMLYILWSAPSGLLLYWLVGNIVGFTQQFLINRWTDAGSEDPAANEPGEKPERKKSGSGRPAPA